jgi:cytochrome c peroxidase
MQSGKTNNFTIAITAMALAFSLVAAADPGETELLKRAQGIFKPLPKNMATAEFPVTPERAELGRALFFDPRVSLDGTVSCARCHQPSLYGADALPKAIGVKDRANPRNSPTVLNAALQSSAGWLGDRVNVEDQAVKILTEPHAFGQPDLDTAMAKLQAIPGYLHLFQKAFPGEKAPVTAENWGKAIGAFERTLVTPSPFDAFLEGDVKALSPMAKAGLELFINSGCVTCHNGAGVGGGMLQKFGVKEDYWKATGSKDIDNGRFEATKKAEDMYVFKVPSLRNVAMTAPYFHDGAVATLGDAVRAMARVQLGKQLKGGEVEQIVAFLGSLTGALPKDFANAPILPAGAFRPPAPPATAASTAQPITPAPKP